MTARCRAVIGVLVLTAAGCGAEAGGPTLGDSAPPSFAASAPDTTGADTVEEPEASAPTAAATVPDMALVAADGRAVVVRGGVASDPLPGLVAADRATLITHTVADGTTTVRWVDLADGTETGSIDITGDLTVVAAGLHGEFVALTGTPQAAPGGTDLAVVSPDGIAFRHDYDAELLPEGFANALTDAGVPFSVFVVEYLGPPSDAPEAPRPYRVRVVDLTTGGLGLPYNLRDKGQVVDQEMLGYGRSHALSRRDGLLFTLYRGIDADDFHNAFVHTLGFGNGVWCLDLPNELALDHLPGAITLTDDDSRLLVASGNGLVTEFRVDDVLDLNREPLAARTVQGWTPSDEISGTAVASAGHLLIVGQGHTVRWLDTTSLTEQSSFETAFDVESVAVDSDGTVTAAGDGFVAQVGRDGQSLGAMALPAGFGPIASVVLLDT
jgi:hypothetical protein